MANDLYNNFRGLLLEGEFNWVEDDVHAVLIDLNKYSPDFDEDESLDDIPTNAIIGSPVLLEEKGINNGAASAADVLFEYVEGDSVEAILLYKVGETIEESPLIILIDTAMGLPYTPNGGNILIKWDGGPNKIFKV